MRNAAAVIICIIGGILMIIASIVGSAANYEGIIEYLTSQYPAYQLYLRIFLTICIYIALGGGISVIVGSIITFKVLSFGRWIIGLGAGMGLITFIIFVVTGIMAGTLTGTFIEIIVGLFISPTSYGIIGVFITIFARRAMGKGKKEEE
ncbi:MAG: hypothetical protein ACFFAN_17360 [Promethearchaeota archaeon]